jgi:hypothetical protein
LRKYKGFPILIYSFGVGEDIERVAKFISISDFHVGKVTAF